MASSAEIEQVVEAVMMVLDLEDEGWTIEQIKEKLNEMLGQDPDVPTPGTDKTFVVTAEKANARYAWRTNDVGRPIMQIYPADNAPVRERIQFTKGMLVLVLPDKVKADGGDAYWAISEEEPIDVDKQLYLREVDGKIQL